MYEQLEQKIKDSYESGVTTTEAEKLASEFLYAQIQVSKELKKFDLDARMKKSGVKAIRSAIRTNEVSKHEKKPTEGALEDSVNTNQLVMDEQEKLDNAEVSRDDLERYYSIFREAHIHYRGIAKGAFGG